MAGPRKLLNCITAVVELLATLVVPKEHLHLPVSRKTLPHNSSPTTPFVGKTKDNGNGNDPVAEVKKKLWDLKRRDS